MVGIPERALRPLINEKDPDIRPNALQKIGSGVTKGQPMEVENIKRIIDEVEECISELIAAGIIYRAEGPSGDVLKRTEAENE